jgi:hypothetical protein
MLKEFSMSNFKISEEIKKEWLSWPSPVVARTEIKKFTGGALSGRTVANLDSRGEGPEGRFRLGRKTVYPKDKLVEWLERRMSQEA